MAEQPEIWLKFYELAWAKRQEKLKSFISEGDDAHAAVQKLLRFEDFHSLRTDEKTQAFDFIKVEPEADVPVLPTGRALTKFCSYGESIFELPTYLRAVDFLLDYLDQHSFDAIVELGAGYAQNLIEIYYRGGPRKVPYFAGEYTRSGRETAQFLAGHAAGMQLTSFAFDHKAPNLSVLGSKKNVLIFSSHSIEQVTEIPSDYFKILSKAATRVTGIHFEPFGYQIDGQNEDEVSITQRQVFEERKWNRNFFSTISNSHRANEIRLTYLHKNALAGDPTCPTSLAIWESA